LIDIPLFFENQNYDIKKSIVVYTSKDIQLKRLIKRDNISKQKAINMINHQMDIEQKKLLSTYIIDNNKDLTHLIKEIENIKEVLLV
jgi:dephospho-CoA kinase